MFDDDDYYSCSLCGLKHKENGEAARWCRLWRYAIEQGSAHETINKYWHRLLTIRDWEMTLG